ncbi:MAG TPA: cytochrome C oxidase subunit I, partial [Rhodoferax sp.]|nr:cytochrome C oxidase subunit I [Rhodoferax sp.]
ANYGELLKVTPLQQTAATLIDGKSFNLDTLQGKWLMVHVGSARCDAACTQQLYLMRQLRITQGKEQSRIERVWVVTDSGTPDAALPQAHPGLLVWRPTDEACVAQFSAVLSRGDHIYLVDPLGNLMLRFPAQPDAKRMMKDLKLLLKASQIG